MDKTLPRPIHNTSSRNFVKLDYIDLRYIKEWFNEYTKYAVPLEDEMVTISRVDKIMKFMEENR